jgi:hypothetical protein
VEFFNRAQLKIPIKIRSDTLDRGDGSFIVRYRIYRSYYNLVIQITNTNGLHLAESPFHLEGWSNTDECNCPEESLGTWYQTAACKDTYKQITADMKKFWPYSLNMSVVSEKIISTFNQKYSQSLCHYAISDNNLYRRCFGEHVDFKKFSDSILVSILRKVKLPDLEFFMNLGDWPLTNSEQTDLPIVSWCGSTESNDMVLPTYDLTQSTLEMMRGYN